jgi:hypothetical protein
MRIASATVPVATRILNGFSDGSCRHPNSVACDSKREVNKPPVGFLICFSLQPQHTITNRVFPARFSVFALALFYSLYRHGSSTNKSPTPCGPRGQFVFRSFRGSSSPHRFLRSPWGPKGQVSSCRPRCARCRTCRRPSFSSPSPLPALRQARSCGPFVLLLLR